MACPVLGDAVALTNSHWRFGIDAVRQSLGVERLEVVNDFQAVALSVPHLTPADWMALGGGEPVAGSPIAVLGPGTGLGVSALIPQPDGGWSALATEGGHRTMAPADEMESRVLDWLRAQGGHVSAERVLSGAGLVHLHAALAAVTGEDRGCATPDQVSSQGLSGACPVCQQALAMFFAMLGTVAGDLALTYGATGGVYLAGGILPRMPQALAQSAFHARFLEKGRFCKYLAPIPVRLITHPQPAFAGLAGLVG